MGIFLISSGSPHVRPMGRTCGEPDEIELTRHGGEIERLSSTIPSRCESISWLKLDLISTKIFPRASGENAEQPHTEMRII